MPSEPEAQRRLEAARAVAERWLAAIRARENAELCAEAASGRKDERAQLLPRIRALVSEVVLPLVWQRQQLLAEVGALWVGEESWRRGNLPRIFVEYRSRIVDPDAPWAALILGFHPDGQVILTWQIKAPLRHTATHLRRLEELSPEIVAEEIDTFLGAAVIGRIVSEPHPP
ncbi:MAG TPA: hypothetical protein VJ770_13620 [Stellaceae bacterium]|nr:hypothetical protein [Stellaceae bacterium]